MQHIKLMFVVFGIGGTLAALSPIVLSLLGFSQFVCLNIAPFLLFATAIVLAMIRRKGDF